MISLYYTGLKNVELMKGQAFNAGGGFSNSLSLLELFSLLEDITEAKLKYDILPVRSSDQKIFVADVSKLKNTIGWAPKVSPREGVVDMVNWLTK